MLPFPYYIIARWVELQSQIKSGHQQRVWVAYNCRPQSPYRVRWNYLKYRTIIHIFRNYKKKRFMRDIACVFNLITPIIKNPLCSHVAKKKFDVIKYKLTIYYFIGCLHVGRIYFRLSWVKKVRVATIRVDEVKQKVLCSKQWYEKKVIAHQCQKLRLYWKIKIKF